MNLVIVYGKIISIIDFKFIYKRYKCEEKYKHISIAKSKIKLLNNSIVEIYCFDEIADFIYRNLREDDFVLIEGKLDSEMKIECRKCEIHNYFSNKKTG